MDPKQFVLLKIIRIASQPSSSGSNQHSNLFRWQFFESSSEHLGSQLGYKHFVTCFFGSCVYLGASGGDLGCILKPLGAILGSSWNLLGVSWQLLGGLGT